MARLDVDIKSLFDGERERKLEKTIKERIFAWEKGTRITKAEKFWDCIGLFENYYKRYYKKQWPLVGLDRWYCGLAQILELTDPQIYKVIPYLLTSYMYNFYLIANGERLYVNQHHLSGHAMVKEFLSACAKREKKVNDRAIFGVDNEEVPCVGIGNLLIEDSCCRDSSFSMGETTVRNKLGYIANDFIFPEMTRVELAGWQDVWIPTLFATDVKGIYRRKQKIHCLDQKTCDPEEKTRDSKVEAYAEIRKSLTQRNQEEIITVTELNEAYSVWFYIFLKHSDWFGCELKIDPIASTVLFYKNFWCAEVQTAESKRLRRARRQTEEKKIMEHVLGIRQRTVDRWRPKIFEEHEVLEELKEMDDELEAFLRQEELAEE